MEVDKKTGDNVFNVANKFLDTVAKVADNISTNIGMGTAVGGVGSAMVKHTVGTPPLQRGAMIGMTCAVTALGTKIGMEGGAAIAKNINIKDSIKKSPHSDPDVEKIPSPVDTNFTVPSILEDGGNSIGDTSPLEMLLSHIFTLNILILLNF